jgi:hypothetical protein
VLPLALALLIAAPQEGAVLPIKEGGFCTGLAWVAATEASGWSQDIGPDFSVYRYNGPDGKWLGIYGGNASQVSNSSGKRLFARDGVTVRSTIVDGKFRGYLATNKAGWQNHFFGSVFNNTPQDRAFFDRVDFGPVGREKCRRYQ